MKEQLHTLKNAALSMAKEVNYWWILLPLANFVVLIFLASPSIPIGTLDIKLKKVLNEQQVTNPEIKEFFAQKGLPLSEFTYVKPLKRSPGWSMHDHSRGKYSIKEENGALQVSRSQYQISKPQIEDASIVLLGIFFAIILARCLQLRHHFLIWLTLFVGTFLCREIHFAGTSKGVYIAAIVLLLVLLKNYEAWQEYTKTPMFRNLLFLSLFTYVLSQTVARRAWKIIPGEEFFASATEEYLEFLGHCFLSMIPVFVRKKKEEEG